MRLVIDTRNGIAGDITAAGLMGLGADAGKVCAAMEAAGAAFGEASASHFVKDGINRVGVRIPEMPDHLHADEARRVLEATMSECGITRPWSDMGKGALEALVQAEAHVHAHHPALKGHFHGHEQALHEAADIVVDIAGMAAGMMDLDILEIHYVDHVNVGSGRVRFSHGELEVPTPATRRILDLHAIPWATSDLPMEATTPTGAAILAGCRAGRVSALPEKGTRALAGGTRPLPPVCFMLPEDY